MKIVSSPSTRGKTYLTYNEAHEFTRRVPTFRTRKQEVRDKKIVSQIIMASEDNDVQKTLDLFFHKNRLLSNPVYWEVLRTLWIAYGGTSSAYLFIPCFLSDRKAKSWLMTVEDATELERMRYPVTLYRAVENVDDHGISWTSDLEWCKTYARAMNRDIKTRSFNRDEILAYFSRRGESEFIIIKDYEQNR